MSGAKFLEHYVDKAVRSADTAFQGLVFLGSLRDTYSGRYVHEGWTELASSAQVCDVAKKAHDRLFDRVLHLSLIELCHQLRAHFESIKQCEAEASLLWLQTELFRFLIPPGCSAVARELFFSNIRTALEVLSLVPDWQGLTAPVALPHSRPDQLLPHQ